MSADSENFIGHLSHSHDLVRSWPDWKKNIWPDSYICEGDGQEDQKLKRSHSTSPLIASGEMLKRK